MKIRNKIKTNWNISTRFLVTLIFIVIIEEILEGHEKKIEGIMCSDADFFSAINSLCEAFCEFLNEFATPQLRSLFKEYPKIKKLVISCMNESAQNIADYLSRGKTLGLICQDTDTLLMAKSLNHIILGLLKDESIEHIDYVTKKLLKYFINGIKRI